MNMNAKVITTTLHFPEAFLFKKSKKLFLVVKV